VLLKGGTLLLHCLSNGRVVEVVDLDFASPGPVSDRVLGPLDQHSMLNYSYHHAAVTAMLTRQGEVIVAMGTCICFSWDPASWRVYPAMRLSNQLRTELTRVCTGKNKALAKHLARHLTTIALTLRDDRLGALLVVSPSEEMIERLIRNRQEAVPPVEALYSRLFVGRPLCKLSPRLLCNAASLDGAIVINGNSIVRGIDCIFEPQGVHTPAEGARTRAAMFASKDGVALKLSQDGEMSVFSNSENQATIFSPVW
jgi:DNA integrity scanning protein DisA with diadenylate cyclase activity